ncbi:MAG TPA: hypothetical protein VK716_08195 [Terracidiphilus sp.]|jgi:hypothetical protein|nr:hypothetical protein [Terracidiphilus sp.]
MKRFMGIALIVGSLTIPALAAKNSQTLTFTQPEKVGSSLLTAGDVKVSWTGTGSNVQVMLEQKGKAPVTVTAKMVDTKNGHVGLVTDSVNGVDVLQSIQLNSFTLVLTGSSSQGE